MQRLISCEKFYKVKEFHDRSGWRNWSRWSRIYRIACHKRRFCGQSQALCKREIGRPVSFGWGKICGCRSPQAGLFRRSGHRILFCEQGNFQVVGGAGSCIWCVGRRQFECLPHEC